MQKSTHTLRVCLIATEFQGIGSYGGFGVLTHDIAMGLLSRGVDVYVAMPRKEGQSPVEVVNGLKIISYPSGLYTGLRSVTDFAGVFRAIDADVYHSQEPSIGSRLAQLAAPGKKHIVTFQDPRNLEDWRKQWAPHRPRKIHEWQFLWQYRRESGTAARRADARYCQAKYIIQKAKKLFHLAEDPGFLPNPVPMFPIQAPKANVPTVCFLGRWDTIKRPELFLDLALQFTNVEFILAGDCLNDPVSANKIRRRCGEMRNVGAPGWVGQEERNIILDRSWIMVNTSSKECLPISYLEAASHKCAILSHCNADDFASNFGFWAEKGDLGDYASGLKYLLEHDKWKNLGEKAYEYVKSTHENERVIDQHLAVYRQILGMEPDA
jgi:glycosyltransferase involved in cell wall biosynthesis